MWDLFDFNSDGKTSIFEKVVGIELLESTSPDEGISEDGSESDGDDLDGDDSSDFDEDDAIFNDDGDDDLEKDDNF